MLMNDQREGTNIKAISATIADQF